ncbi:MAG TPA: hypothetical protein VE988_01670 [Gemmataceae bacterium]|nr:hypothetical protein [Gemmataceae bacterium]
MKTNSAFVLSPAAPSYPVGESTLRKNAATFGGACVPKVNIGRFKAQRQIATGLVHFGFLHGVGDNCRFIVSRLSGAVERNLDRAGVIATCNPLTGILPAVTVF